MKPPTPTPEQNFIERYGLHSEADGLPRIAGRIVAYLVLSEHPCSAAELAEELKISHGSVSTNTRLLERLRFIERTTVPGDRASYYRITNDPYASILIEQLERTKQLNTMVIAAKKEIAPERVQGRRRLAEMVRFNRLVIRVIEELIADWGKEQEIESNNN